MLKKNIIKAVLVIIILIFIQEIVISEKQIDFNASPAFKIEEEKVFKLLQNLNNDIEATTTSYNCTSPKWTILIHFALDNNLSNNTDFLHDFEVLESLEAKEDHINSGPVMLQFHNTTDEDWLFFSALGNDIITINLQTGRNDFNNLLECCIYHESDLEHEIGYLYNTAVEQFQCPSGGKILC